MPLTLSSKNCCLNMHVYALLNQKYISLEVIKSLYDKGFIKTIAPSLAPLYLLKRQFSLNSTALKL
jgi:hypothetical protein